MLCKISDLKPGDQFIWADERTRSVMLVDFKNGYRAKIITFLELLPNNSFRFSDAYGGEKTYMFRDSNRVYKLHAGSQSVLDVNYEVPCAFCNIRYGSHFGLVCPDHPGGIFAPDIFDATIFDSAMESSDWLEAELGL